MPYDIKFQSKLPYDFRKYNLRILVDNLYRWLNWITVNLGLTVHGRLRHCSGAIYPIKRLIFSSRIASWSAKSRVYLPFSIITDRVETRV